MTTSSNVGPPIQVLDTPLLVYSLLQNHPASSVCSQYIQSQGIWTTSSLVLLETRAILTNGCSRSILTLLKTFGRIPAAAVIFLRLQS